MNLIIKDDPRLAGQVIRYHTWPHVRQQSVGEHSWQICRILLAIAPDHCNDLLRHAIVHDIGEVGVGDIPYPVKLENPEMGKLFRDAEQRAAEDVCNKWSIPSPVRELSYNLRWIFKLAEFIEMWEWGMEERLRGNRFSNLVEKRCKAAIDSMLADPTDVKVATLADQYIMRRSLQWGNVND